MTWDSGGTRNYMSTGGTSAQSNRSLRGSQRRAANHRRRALERLRQQVGDGDTHEDTLRQRFDIYRGNRYSNNNNCSTLGTTNIGWDEQNSIIDFNIGDKEARERQRLITLSEQDAIRKRQEAVHVPRIGHISMPKPGDTIRWMYCQVNGMAGDTGKLKQAGGPHI
jgi:hypothetical protein